MAVWKAVLVKVTLTVEGYPRYEVSDEGDVRLADEWSDNYGRLLNKHIFFGEPCVWLNNGSGRGVGRIYRISELMKEAFGTSKIVRKKESKTSSWATGSLMRPVDTVKNMASPVASSDKSAVCSDGYAKPAVPSVEKPVEAAVKPVEVPVRHVTHSEEVQSRRNETFVYDIPRRAPAKPDTHLEETASRIKEDRVSSQSESAPRQVEVTTPVKSLGHKEEPTKHETSSVKTTFKPETDAEKRSKAVTGAPFIPVLPTGRTVGHSRVKKAVRQLDKNGKVIKVFDSGVAASAATGVPQSSISACCRGRVKSAGGFCWGFVD